VASPEACASVVAESAAALDGLDGLVLNVGIGLGRGMDGTTAAQWDQTFAVNTRAHFLVAAAALPVLAPGSAIVFISSAASLRAATGIPAYDASKAALPGICRQVAREGMARGIRANLVVPSLVDTPGSRRAAPAVREAGDGLGGGLRHGVAAVRGIQLRQRPPAGTGRRRDQLRLTAIIPPIS
jgi:NAD(P)-dependent dehydrogenase (short-subunit alcohol dehydrogenase family)